MGLGLTSRTIYSSPPPPQSLPINTLTLTLTLTTVPAHQHTSIQHKHMCCNSADMLCRSLPFSASLTGWFSLSSLLFSASLRHLRSRMAQAGLVSGLGLGLPPQRRGPGCCGFLLKYLSPPHLQGDPRLSPRLSPHLSDPARRLQQSPTQRRGRHPNSV